MKNRFDMEQEIMSCWNVTEDMNVLLEAVMETNIDKDGIANALLGMHQIYELKFQRLMETFETVVRNRELG